MADWLAAVQAVCAPSVMLYALIGVCVGMLIGTLPGLTSTMAIAILTPLTFWLEPTQGFAMLIGVYNSALFSGGISAIVINTPGTPASIATTFDGYSLTQRGQGALALGINTIYSVLGGLLSTVVLMVAAFPLANFALRFGPAEFSILAFFGLTMMVSVSQANPVKGLLGFIGLMLSTVGLDPINGAFDIVRDCMQDDTVRGFMNKMLYEEVIPTLPLDKKDLEGFAAAVQDRFNNPFVDHELMSISLNSTSKWRARNPPSLLEYVEAKGTLPPCLTMSFAAYAAFFSSDIQGLTDQGLVCRRPAGNEYVCSDDRWVLETYYSHRSDSAEALIHAVMTDERMWGRDLTQIPGFETAAASGLRLIREKGAKAAYASCL